MHTESVSVHRVRVDKALRSAAVRQATLRVAVYLDVHRGLVETARPCLAQVIDTTIESGEKLQAAEDIEDSGPCWSLSAGVVQDGSPHGSHAVGDAKNGGPRWSHVADIVVQHGGPLGSHVAEVVKEGVPRESHTALLGFDGGLDRQTLA